MNDKITETYKNETTTTPKSETPTPKQSNFLYFLKWFFKGLFLGLGCIVYLIAMLFSIGFIVDLFDKK